MGWFDDEFKKHCKDKGGGVTWVDDTPPQKSNLMSGFGAAHTPPPSPRKGNKAKKLTGLDVVHSEYTIKN